MKKILQHPDNPTLTIKAKDFATELTSHNTIEKDLKGENKITTEHVENNEAVRKILIEKENKLMLINNLSSQTL